jgi:hypothetical protein
MEKVRLMINGSSSVAGGVYTLDTLKTLKERD